MTFLSILSLLLLLLVDSRANLFQNESAISLNRTRRLSYASYNENTITLAKFAVSIRTRTVHKYYGDNHFCGGVILAPLFVLTSSHCVINSQRNVYSPRLLLVVAGTPNRLRYQEGRSFHTPVKNIMVPDNFTLRNEEDIAIMLLKWALPRDNDFIAIVNLPLRPVPVGAICRAPGWGRMFASGPISAKILHITVKILNNSVCYKELAIKKRDLLCGRNRYQIKQQPCVGDRGAPLICESTVHGIVSYIVGCDAAELPSVYTDVFQNIDWIRRTIIENLGNVSHVSLLLLYGAVLVHFLATWLQD